MKYDYSVIYDGKFYRAGEEVPAMSNEKTSDKKSDYNSEETTTEVPEILENEGAEAETKKYSSKRKKA